MNEHLEVESDQVLVAESRRFDISKIDFELLRREFAKSREKNLLLKDVQELLQERIAKMLAQNPSRINFYEKYQEIIHEYNQEQNRVAIEKTFEDLMKLSDELTEEEKRYVREGFDNDEQLSMFDVLMKDDLTKEDIKNLNPFYLAPERFNGVCAIQSDLFSVGAMMYQMIFGVVPWFFDISAYKPEDRANAILAKRCSQLRIPDINIFELDEQLINTMAKAMASDIKDRFQSADEFIQALNGEITIETTKATLPTEVNGIRTIKKGNGFADVAGMDDLKAQLKSDVIDLLENAGRAKELGLSIPNGLLFYGPPGCGKTFFAERFAEEIGCNYMYVLCSDVASPYIHGGQEKIANIFTEARKNAPTIVFLDEVEAMIMDRNKHSNVSEQGEVNEFLGQLNNCGHDGVMVIAATNKPGLIDPAALRAGRLELKYYIPQPDFETRKQLFKVGLRNRNVDLGIDYEKLSQLTEDRVSADIQLIVDTAARIVFRKKREKITMSELEEAISTIEPTVSKEEIHDAEKVRDEFLGKKTNTRPRIGF